MEDTKCEPTQQPFEPDQEGDSDPGSDNGPPC